MPCSHPIAISGEDIDGDALRPLAERCPRVGFTNIETVLGDPADPKLPAGKLERGEPPLQTARRELVEECGYEAAEWWHVATLHPSIGYSDEVIEIFGAKHLTHVGAQLDPGEHLEVFPATIDDALAWVREGIVTDTKTMIALFWWKQFGRKGP